MHTITLSRPNRLEELLLEGLTQGGDDIKLDQKFWTDLKKEAKAMAEQNATKHSRHKASRKTL